MSSPNGYKYNKPSKLGSEDIENISLSMEDGEYEENVERAHTSSLRQITMNNKFFHWSFLGCFFKKRATASEYLTRIFTTHIIIYILAMIVSFTTYAMIPLNRKEMPTHIHPAYVPSESNSTQYKIFTGIALILVNSICLRYARIGKFSYLYVFVITVNCILDFLGVVLYTICGFVGLLAGFFVKNLMDGAEGKSVEEAGKFVTIMFHLSYAFFAFVFVFLALITQSCTACQAACHLKQEKIVIEEF